MAVAKKKTTRGRKQDRARVAGGQDYEVPLRVEEDRTLCAGGEEGRQEGRQHPQARGKTSRALKERKPKSPLGLSAARAAGRPC
jgi:hypothetical protein